jgi:hypothetical protein
VSRGLGRCQREIIALLKGAPEHRLSRAVLEEALIREGYYESNLLRALRSLARGRLVNFEDRRRKADSIVSLPQPMEPMSDDEILDLLAQVKDAEAKR